MKYIFGGIITLLLLATLAFYLLGLWGVEIPVTSADLTKAWITGLVVLGALLVFTVILPFFFGGRSNRYDNSLIIKGHGLHLYSVGMEAVTYLLAY